jgi:hypothetical protein
MFWKHTNLNDQIEGLINKITGVITIIRMIGNLISAKYVKIIFRHYDSQKLCETSLFQNYVE